MLSTFKLNFELGLITAITVAVAVAVAVALIIDILLSFDNEDCSSTNYDEDNSQIEFEDPKLKQA